MLKKLCLFQIIILTLRHKNKKLVSIMAKTERQNCAIFSTQSRELQEIRWVESSLQE